MLPSNLPGTFGAGASDTQVIFPKATLKAPESLSEMLSRYPSFPNSTYPFSNPYSNLSAHLPALLPPFAMGRHKQAPLKSFNAASGRSDSKRDDSQPLIDTNRFATISLRRLKVRFSRLPSKFVTRKAPLRGTCRASNPTLTDTGRKFPMPKQQQCSSQRQDPVDGENPIRKRLRSAVFKAPEEQERVVLYDTVKEGGDKGKEEAPATAEIQKSIESEDEGDTDDRNDEESHESQDTSSDSASAAGRRPTHNYEVPLELESLRQALGPDSWNEYIFLIESLWLNKITAHELDGMSKPIFNTHDDAIRRKIHGIVTRMMVRPQLTELGVINW